MKHPPYLSIIAASRNDSHGGNMLKRMRLFVAGLIRQTTRHGLPAELILVEWNPPPQQPRLKDLLPAPEPGDLLSIRYIEVPAGLHQRFKRAQEIPLFQMIAKNAGIRRARGEFVLCTNVDLLFPDPLMSRLAERNLRKDRFYRANRCDVPDGIDPQWDVETQLDWCARHVIRRLGRDARFGQINLEALGLSRKPFIKKWLFNQFSRLYQPFWPEEKRQFFQLDTFACGDFTLMSREAWLDIRGYLELDLYSIHIDSLALMAAAALGYRQHVFERSLCTYHIDHPLGWEGMSPLEKIKFLEQRPGIDYSLLYEAGLDILRQKKRLELNPDDWGFASHDLPETQCP